MEITNVLGDHEELHRLTIELKESISYHNTTKWHDENT